MIIALAALALVWALWTLYMLADSIGRDLERLGDE